MSKGGEGYYRRKINMFLSATASCQNQDISAKSRVSLIKGPDLQFSVDEQLIIEDIHNKFEVSWLENFIKHDRYLFEPQEDKIPKIPCLTGRPLLTGWNTHFVGEIWTRQPGRCSEARCSRTSLASSCPSSQSLPSSPQLTSTRYVGCPAARSVSSDPALP